MQRPAVFVAVVKLTSTSPSTTTRRSTGPYASLRIQALCRPVATTRLRPRRTSGYSTTTVACATGCASSAQPQARVDLDDLRGARSCSRCRDTGSDRRRSSQSTSAPPPRAPADPRLRPARDEVVADGRRRPFDAADGQRAEAPFAGRRAPRLAAVGARAALADLPDARRSDRRRGGPPLRPGSDRRGERAGSSPPSAGAATIRSPARKPARTSAAAARQSASVGARRARRAPTAVSTSASSDTPPRPAGQRARLLGWESTRRIRGRRLPSFGLQRTVNCNSRIRSLPSLSARASPSCGLGP